MEEWLASIGLAERIAAFREQRITADELHDLTEGDLRELGLTIGERRRLQRALADGGPPSSTLQSLANPEAIPKQAESRPLTVLFADLVDSTGLAERIEPEDLLEVMRLYREFCGQAIERYGGRIARFLGDGILAYFCYPIANENDPERAIRAALEIVRGIGSLITPVGETLRVRMGLSTGRVLISDLFAGGAADVDTIVGSCPNLAARLQTLAGANEIVVAERTHAAVESHFECQPLGLRHIRGFEQSHAVWRVLGERAPSDRRLTVHSTMRTTFVGREIELDLLRLLWRKARAGEGTSALISGEPGIGKSRLVEQFLADQKLTDANTVRIGASAFDENSPFKPFADYLRAAARISALDDPESAQDRLGDFLRGAPEQHLQALALLVPLLGLPEHLPLRNDWSPERLREETITVLADQMVALATGAPVCILVEDLHWLDPSSRELLEHLIEIVPQHPVLLLVTCRPGLAGEIGSKVHTTLRLERLTPGDVVELMHGLLGTELVASLAGRVLERTDGVPLFVEEVTRALLQRGDGTSFTAAVDRSIPASLEESLIARLDRSGGAKEIAQIGSVIGRSVRRDVLAAVSRTPEPRLSEALAALVRLGILDRPRGGAAETYLFHHALLQDAAYASLLRERRRELHARVAEALEALDPEGVTLYPENLAQHLAEAGQAEQAAPRWMEAARRSLSRSALQEAARLLQRALTDLERLPETPKRLQLRIEVSALLGPVLIGIKGGKAPDTQALYTNAYEICQRLPDSPAHFPILWGWWRISPYDPERAPALLRHARTTNDSGHLLEAHHCSWAVDFNQGRFSDCEQHIRAGLAIYERGDFAHHAPLYGNHDAKVCAHGNRSQLYWMQGRLQAAMEEERHCLAWADKVGHLGSRVHALGLTLLHRVYRRELKEVYERSARLIDLTREHGMADHGAAGVVFQGWVMALEGEPTAGLKRLEDGLARQREVAANEDLAVYLCLLAEVLMTLHRSDEAVELIGREQPLLESSDLWIWYPELMRMLGEATLRKDSPSFAEALSLFERAKHLAQSQQAAMLTLRTAASRVRLARSGTGDLDAARRALAAALAQVAEPDNSEDIVQARALLSPGEANALIAEARD